MIRQGDCREVLKDYKDDYFDSVVTDPPYGLSKEPDIREVLTMWMAGEDYQHRGGGFMGKTWDSFVPGPSVWREVFRVLKPGGYALVFAGTRTQDLMTIALRLAGFEVRDVIEWLYFSGFPKSMDVGKAFDKRAGAEREFVRQISHGPGGSIGGAAYNNGDGRYYSKDPRKITALATDLAKQWDGWGTALKPAHEPIIVARKPLIGTVLENVEQFGTGGLNIDGCRIPRQPGDRTEYGVNGDEPSSVTNEIYGQFNGRLPYEAHALGRFPANIVTVEQEGFFSSYCNVSPAHLCHKANEEDRNSDAAGNEISLQASTTDDGRKKSIDNPFLRGETLRKNSHPTVKPTNLMAWLIRLVTPPRGKVLDPFCGSGSTIVAALREGFEECVGIELEESSTKIATARANTLGMQIKLF